MKWLKYIFSVLILLVITSCNNRESKYNYLCGIAPSTPTDLVIINESSEKVEIDLLVKEDTLKRFGRVKIGANEEKQICIENEGEITKGLYFDFNGERTKVVLNSTGINKFYVKNRIFIK